jgi:phosphopantothenoylcysteine decarboxylase/phosphopantothenate--cysteine ligase
VLEDRRILLIVSGGIAAVKVPDLIRRLRERGAHVRCILTEAGAQFVTPMSLAALSGDKVFQNLFSLTDESEMGHIRLSREADIILVAPATANMMAKMVHGMADDLATTVLLAADKPVMIAPSMNVMMWSHPATQANLAVLQNRDVHVVGPGAGDLACGEVGDGRMAEVADIVHALSRLFQTSKAKGPLTGYKVLVTSGPTVEPIDPVRYIANRSSGKQGHAIATAVSALGATVRLITGPTHEPDPDGIDVSHVETAEQMLEACRASLPADIAICAAAVADWRITDVSREKLKKVDDNPPSLQLTENPDILATLAEESDTRPDLVIGFAAETENVIKNGTAKLETKHCDWIVANDVSDGFGGDSNTVHLITETGVDSWPTMGKRAVAERLADRIVEHANRHK